MTVLSLCMIVRDEAALLGACLESVRGAVDEVVVVDTGSQDATRQIALAHGARVVDFTWCDDFAAARNEALRHASGRWVLVLDADERLAAGSGPVLRRAVRDARFDLGLLRLHDAARLTSAVADVVRGVERASEVQLVPRLMRRCDGLAFVDRIHENVTPWLRRRGSKIGGVDVDIVHYGATRELVESRHKNERNVRMLRERVALDPADVCAAGYLAHELMRAGALGEAHALAERAWGHVQAAALATAPSIHRLATARAHLLILRGDPEGARATAIAARALEGDNPDLRYFEAYALERMAFAADAAHRSALLDEARAAYEACLGFGDRVFAQSFVVGATTWAARLRLGLLSLVQGRAGTALAAFDAILATRPAEDTARLGRAEALIELGRPADALRVLEPLLGGQSADAWTLSAAAALALGRGDDARVLAGRAVALDRVRPVAPHRSERLRAMAR